MQQSNSVRVKRHILQDVVLVAAPTLEVVHAEVADTSGAWRK